MKTSRIVIAAMVLPVLLANPGSVADKIRSDPHSARMCCFGVFLLPIIPTALFGGAKEFKYDQVLLNTNTGSNGVVRVVGLVKAAVCTALHPSPAPDSHLWKRGSANQLQATAPEVLQLQPTERVQIGLPETKRSEPHLKLNGKIYTIPFKEDTGYIWHRVGI